jgi:DNA-binding NtrC family response regulator
MAKLLVVEDDHLMRWSLEECLRRAGHAVHSVDSGTAAIEAARQNDFRVVITDYRVPGPDGLHLLQRIKAQSPQAHVILITAHASPEMERQARNMGAFDFFDKPFELAELKQAVVRASLMPERRKGPRGCCGGCEWKSPCGAWLAILDTNTAHGG